MTVKDFMKYCKVGFYVFNQATLTMIYYNTDVEHIAVNYTRQAIYNANIISVSASGNRIIIDVFI